jgi:hypothetical protein
MRAILKALKMRILISAVLVGALAQPALSCDLCSIYAASQAQGGSGAGFFGGVAEQFTEFGTVQTDGHKVASEGQYIDSSVSQVFAGYTINDQFSVQLNLPVIYRAYGSDTQHSVVSGIGDLSLLATFNAYRKMSEHFTFDWTMLGGVKFPTGNSSKLNTPDSALPEGIGGHDIALGSGSYDGLIGTGIYARCRKWFFTGNVQYSIRSEGDFHHQYANDLVWFGGPGYYLMLGHSYTLAFEAVIAGETKGKDTFSGVPDGDSAETLVYSGPQLNFTWATRLSAQLAGDLPVVRENSGTQVMPDYRIRAALTWRF